MGPSQQTKSCLPECLEIGGRTIPLVIRFWKKARHFRLRLNHKNQVVASVPWRCSKNDVLSFIDRQYPWLEQQVVGIPEVTHLSDWLRKHPFLSAGGERFPVRIESSIDCLRATYQFTENGTKLLLRVPRCSGQSEAALLKLVKSFAKDALGCRLNDHARRLNLEFDRLTVRDQSSRWGSCSSKRTISLNWRLVLIGPELQDYILLHELAHLTEMNHSRRFWDLLDSYDPFRLDHESELKKVTRVIMRIGRR